MSAEVTVSGHIEIHFSYRVKFNDFDKAIWWIDCNTENKKCCIIWYDLLAESCILALNLSCTSNLQTAFVKIPLKILIPWNRRIYGKKDKKHGTFYYVWHKTWHIIKTLKRFELSRTHECSRTFASCQFTSLLPQKWNVQWRKWIWYLKASFRFPFFNQLLEISYRRINQIEELPIEQVS